MARYVSKLPILIAEENLKRVRANKPPLEVREIANGANVSRQTVHRWTQLNKPLHDVSDEARRGFMKFFGLKDESELYDVIEELAWVG